MRDPVERVVLALGVLGVLAPAWFAPDLTSAVRWLAFSLSLVLLVTPCGRRAFLVLLLPVAWTSSGVLWESGPVFRVVAVFAVVTFGWVVREFLGGFVSNGVDGLRMLACHLEEFIRPEVKRGDAANWVTWPGLDRLLKKNPKRLRVTITLGVLSSAWIVISSRSVEADVGILLFGGVVGGIFGLMDGVDA